MSHSDKNGVKLFLQEHLFEKLRSELELTSVRSASAGLALVVIYQIAAFPVMRDDPYYHLVTLALALTYVFRFFIKKFENLSNREWLFVHLLTVTLHSTFWALTLLEVTRASFGHPQLYVITYLVFSGLIAAAAYSLAISRRDFYAFITPIVIAQVGALLLNPGDIPFKIASVLLTILFFAFLGQQRRRIEASWIEQRTQNFELQNIIDAVPGGISVLKGNLYYRVNRYIRNLMPPGVSIVGYPIGGRWNDNPEFTDRIKEFVASREKRTQFEADLTAQGQKRCYLVTGIKSFNDETIISTIDIEDMKQIEREMLHQKSQLEHNAKMAALGEMAGGLAHEINNPVAIISGRAQQLILSLNKDAATKESLLKGLENINQTSQRINRIVRGLRAFSHDTTHEPFVEANLKQIVEDTLTFCEAKFRNNGIKLTYNIPEELSLECSPTQISQVLLNALNNSHDAIVDPTEPLEPVAADSAPKWIRIEAALTDDQLRISVSDSGSGIPPHLRDKIMQPFFSTKEVGKGTGLGLSISKGIIESHKGQFYFNYENAEHTELVVILPVRQPQKPV